MAKQTENRVCRKEGITVMVILTPPLACMQKSLILSLSLREIGKSLDSFKLP